MRPARIFLAYTLLCLAFFLIPRAAVHGGDLRFSRDILPVLSENCFFCHGPDEENRAADLRLDTEDGALAVVTRGSVDESELIRRVLSNDPDEQMPPPDSNRFLTDAQKQHLSDWVQSGAQWGRHWSFEPLVAPEIPRGDSFAVPLRNAVDAFVQRKLGERGLTPSPEAPRRTLIRRVTLDLTGLPPTPEEVDAFLKDESPNAYENVVDRLLASPAYGERMAWNWLDAARYADSNGYQGDRERTMWPWRDWVVNAFNRNMPFDQFTIEQLAGDLLPDTTPDQQLATGFFRNHMINGEGGRIAEENRVDYVMDMSETMGTVWLGLTLNCCRCHDHKYDPLTQEDYYQFYAFFNQTPVTGAGGDPQTAPNLVRPTEHQRQEMAQLRDQLAMVDAELAGRRRELAAGQREWEQAQLAADRVQTWDYLKPTQMSARHMKLELQSDRSILVTGANAENDTYTVTYPIANGPLTGIRLEALRHESMTNGGIARSNSGNFVLTEIECYLVTGDESQLLPIDDAEATYEQGRLKITKAFDGNSRSGWAVYEGKPIDRDHAAVFRFRQPVDVKSSTLLRVVLYHDSPHKYHNLGRFRFAATGMPQVPLAIDNDLLPDLQTPEAERTDEQRQRILNAFAETDAEFHRLTARRKEIADLQEKVRTAMPRVMVMKDQSKWRKTFVLNRGIYNDATDREVEANTPASLPPIPWSGDHATRLDLARWLVSDDNPLTARVTVNRFWQQVFGIGIVKTVEDFGVQAEYPEHRDLLDWLAADFRDHGWDVKRLMRLMVTSHTYRQSSVVRSSGTTDDDGQELSLAEVDPDNRLLARAPRYRLPSWMLRDQALAVSGLINRDRGGPSINTYQPPGIWEEATFGKKKYQRDSGRDLYRRSLYIFWRRIIAPTMFFDNASRQSCTVKTQRTNTPLHALLTLNETTYVEAARMLAQQLLENDRLSSDSDRLSFAFRRTLCRQPDPSESEVLLAGLARSRRQFAASDGLARELLQVGDSAANEHIDPTELAAWTSVCLTLLNLDEMLTHE